MKIIGGRVRLSATDLANHVACPHLTSLDLAVAQARLTPPEKTAWLPASMQQRGEAHERAYVEHLRARYDRVVDLRDCRFDDDGFRSTRGAMAGGADVLLQAPLGDDRWVGRADVLQRVERRSALGAWSYEPFDTKLARETRGSAILQLCAYADFLTACQGARPERMSVVAPGRPFNVQSYRVDEFFAYYSLVHRRLAAFLSAGADRQTYPEPTTHCEICRWMYECNRKRRIDDRDIAGEMRCRPGREPEAVRAELPDAEADAIGERVLPVSRARETVSRDQRASATLAPNRKALANGIADVGLSQRSQESG